jgi:hypothetical protein
VLDNIRAAVRTRRDVLIRELRELGDVTLTEYLQFTNRALQEIYSGSRIGWMNLRRDAGLPAPPAAGSDQDLVAAISRLLHVDDPERLGKYAEWLRSNSAPTISAVSPRDMRLLNMLHLDLWTRNAEPVPLANSLARLWGHEAIRLELAEVLNILAAESSALVLENRDTQEPLAVHAHYTRDEVLAALGVATPERPPTMREGVVWAREANADVFFVTLRKSEKRFSATTMYRDYAISPREFHWESQSTTSSASPTGQRYINHAAAGSRVLLFARETSEHRAFLYLGPAQYVRHSGDRPISIIWRLDWELPPQFFLEARAVS